MNLSNFSKQQHILNIAEAVFVSHGFKNTTIRKITVEAKINTAMLHYYFESKERLFEAVLNRKIEILTSISQTITDDYDSVKGLKEAIKHLINNTIENKAFFRLLYAELLIGEAGKTKKKIRDFFCFNKHILREILERGMQNKVFKQIDAEIVIVSIFGTLIHSITKIEDRDDDVTKARIQAYFDTYFTSFLY